MIERSEVRFGTTLIPFQIRRSERRATVALAIDAGRLVVTAPHDTAIERLNAVVRGKASWVTQRIHLFDTPQQTGREFVTGETFRYLGRQYRLRVADARNDDEARLERGWLVVPAIDRRDANRRDVVRSALIRWYRLRAEDRLPNCVQRWAEKVRIPAPLVLIRDQRRRWGSCSRSGEIRLNWHLIQAPPALADYVAAHEVVHLARGNDGHSRDFWALLGRLMPHYEARRTALRDIGPSLLW